MKEWNKLPYEDSSREIPTRKHLLTPFLHDLLLTRQDGAIWDITQGSGREASNRTTGTQNFAKDIYSALLFPEVREIP